ncbi:MAG: D-alanyl-D-alanine carboxypeptidase family protein [Clostridia bacterium]
MKKFLNKFIIIILTSGLFFNNVYANEKTISPQPEIIADAYMLFDQDTGNILMSENIDMMVYPASTTKILTAILAIENADLDEMVTITKDAFYNMESGATLAGLVVGEEISVHDLVYCTMLASGNEAANALAIHVGGTVENFIAMMNFRAVQLGAYNSNFSNANGLHGDDHYTTARDMSIIAKYALKNEFFCTVANTAQKTISATNKNAQRIIYTTNQLIFRTTDSRYYAYANGVKTGFTSMAGNCLVSQAEKDGERLIALIFDCAKDAGGNNMTFARSKEMYEWGFENFYKQTLVKELQPMVTVEVRLSSQSDYVSLKVANDLKALVPIDFDEDKISFVFDVPETVDAPIEVDQKIGTVQVRYDGVYHGTLDLLAVSEVELSQVLYYVDVLENFFASSTLRVILVSLVMLVILSDVGVKIKNKMRKRKRFMAKKRKSRYK